MNPIEQIYLAAEMQSVLPPSPIMSDDDGSTTSEEIDRDAPYGRKKNGEPYKTRPSLRKAFKKYQDKTRDKKNTYNREYYSNNRDKCIQSVRNAQAKTADKYKVYQATYYHNRSLELQYYRDLFDEIFGDKV